MSADAQSFPCPELAKMYPGVLYASVPVFENCIQINNQRGIDKTLLHIVRDEYSVTVSRADKKPLQVEINDREAYAAGDLNAFRLFQQPVFQEPLETATFIKKEANWYLREQPTNPNLERLQKFAQRIGGYALIKQKKAAKEGQSPVIVLHPLRGGTYGQPIAAR